MMTHRTAARAQRTIIAFTGALLFPITASATPQGSVVVSSIETQDAESAREVVIHASSKPTFSVFRLSEPFRVLVDINDAKMKSPIDLMKVQDGVIRYVSTNQFADETSAILRVEIALERPTQYEVRARGEDIIVSIKTLKLGTSPAPKPAEAIPVGAAPTAKAAPKPAPEVQPVATVPSVATTPSVAPVSLGKLRRVKRRSKTLLQTKILSGELQEGAIKLEQLSEAGHPERVVIDIANAEASPKWQRLNVRRHGIQRARLASKEDGVRIVLDGIRGKQLPKVEMHSQGGKLQIALTKATRPKPAPVAKAQPAVQPAVRPEVQAAQPVVEQTVVEAPVVEAAPAAKAPANKIVDVLFEPKDGFVRLSVVMDKEVGQIIKEKSARKDAPHIRLRGATLPKGLERTLDVTELAGAVVGSISSYMHGGDTIIAATLTEGTEHRHWVKGKRLMWDFRNLNAEPQVLNYGEQATSGYASNLAARTVGKVAPTKRRYRGRRISLDLKDAEIQNVLRLLADVSKLNIVASDDVKGRITIKLKNVPWDQALDIILRSKQLDKTRNGNIIRVAPIEILRKEEELRLERAKAKIELEPLTVRLIPVSYAVANEIKPQVTALLSPRGKVNIDVRTNVLVVEDIAEVLLKVERLVRTLDTQTPQVLIEARIVEARSNFARELGIQWGGQVSATQQFGTQTGLTFPSNIRIAGGADDVQNNQTQGVLDNPNYAVNLPAVVGSGGGGSLGFIFGSVGGAALINLRLTAAESTGKVKIVSSPKIVTMDNKEAKILSGERVPITVITANGPTTRFIDANIELNVTPHVTQDGSILMKINAKKNEISNRRDLLGVPGIITKEADTEMIVADGDTAVMGGLYQRNAAENEAYVPWLGRIPVLGWLFKTKSRTDTRDELLIFISPRIVNRSAALVSPT